MQIGENKKNREITFYINTFISVVITAGLLIFYFYDVIFQRPVSGEIRVQPEIQTDLKDLPFERFESIYLSFRHGSQYRVNFHEKEIKNNNRILERALLYQSGSRSKKIALTVQDMSSRNLTDMASYNLRKKFIDDYAEREFVLENLSGTFFTSKKDGIFEKTAFILQDQKLIEISFSSAIENEAEAEKEMEDIIKSIQWKK
jgi:hypothetical protein